MILVVFEIILVYDFKEKMDFSLRRALKIKGKPNEEQKYTKQITGLLFAASLPLLSCFIIKQYKIKPRKI